MNGITDCVSFVRYLQLSHRHYRSYMRTNLLSQLRQPTFKFT